VSYNANMAGRRAGRLLVLSTFLYFFVVFQAFQGNTWHRVESQADGDQVQNTSGEMFQPFSKRDWTLFGVTALADFADLDSSYALITHEQAVYNADPRYGTAIPCPPGMTGCFAAHRIPPTGEGNPLITGIFGTKYPTALDYTAWGALELAIQAGIAWALPERWRTGAFGIFIGIGLADTVTNSYGGGVTFRF